MTTLTTRPLPLPPLPLALARPMTCNDRSPSTGSPTPPLSIKAMHPDNVVLSGHGVTSPQLSGSNISGVFCDNLSKNCDRSSHHLPPTPSLPVPAETRDRINRDGRSPFGRSAVSKSVSSDVSYNCGANADDDNCTDRMSCCSDDSELSVGQEGCASNGSDPNFKSFSETVGSVANPRGRQVADDSESADNNSNLSDEQRLESAGDHMLSDDMSNDSSPNPSHETDPAIVSPSMRIPVPIVRPSPTRLQEEFLRKSHLYAEELMKQQMQFMAAARASAFSLRHATISPEVGKVGFRPHVKSSMQPDIGDSLVNFSGIHSHLSAISKISSQLSATDSALSKLTAFGVMSGRDVSHSPPFANQMGLNHPINARHPFINNNLNETNLKFSIDNILKADFGRRITDPLLKRNGNSSCSGNSANGSKNHGNRKSRNSEKQDNAPVDLTNLVTVSSGNSASAESSPSPAFEKQPSSGSSGKSASSTVPSAIPTPPASTASATPTASASGSEATSNSSSSSGGPMVWPAWVYCTRYSDRPSSGRSPRSSGPRTRKPKKPPSEKGGSSSDEKRPRTAFSGPQLARLKHEFNENRYLTERRRQQLSAELGLNEAQIKIWFQNKRAKIKKASGTKNPLALQLMAQGLYNHSTVPLTREEEELQELQAKNTS